MKILLIGSFLHPMYAPAFESGFRRLGHDVVSIDYERYHYGEGLLNSFLSRVQDRLHIGIKLIDYNRDILKKAKEHKPDFVFLYRCYNVWPSTVGRLKKLGFFVFTYNNDDPFSGIPNLGFYRNFHKILRLSDVNFVYRKKNILDYASVGAKNNLLLLPYYIERNNFYESCEDSIPVAFLGHFENDGRDLYIKALVDAGMPVSVFNGADWEKAPLYEQIKTSIKPGKRGLEYNHVINQCKIVIVFLSKLNSDTYTRRCFEIPATKTLMLSEYTDDLDEMFPENECAVYFKSPEELVEKCHYLLNHPEEINRVAEKGFQRIREIGGSEVDRCIQIIEVFKQMH